MSASRARRPGRPRSTDPRLRRDRDRAYVAIDGRKIYLGDWPPGEPEASPDAVAAYHRLLAEWSDAGRPHKNLPAVGESGGPPTVTQIIVKFIAWGRTFYGDGGRPEGSAGR